MERTTAEILAWLKNLAHDGARLRLDTRRVEPGDIFVAVPAWRWPAVRQAFSLRNVSRKP